MTAQFFAPIGNNLRGLDRAITQVINVEWNSPYIVKWYIFSCCKLTKILALDLPP